MGNETITVDGTTYAVNRVCKVTTYSHPNEWCVFFTREGSTRMIGISFPRGEDWRHALFYNVLKGGELVHPRTLESAIRETVG